MTIACLVALTMWPSVEIGQDILQDADLEGDLRAMYTVLTQQLSEQEKLPKTVAIGCVRFINDEVHPDNMEIRDAKEGKEHRYIGDGEEICCPVCGTPWLQEVEGDFTFDSCKHLRFSLASDCGDDFELFGEWDDDGFLKLVEKARAKDEDADILDILNGIQHTDVDKALLHVWYDDPLNHPRMIWGYHS